MKKRTVEVVMMAAMAVAISGCVAVRDSIPIMGENTDGTKVIVANATRTRFYALSKAAEKIELWQVSSDKGVAMKGSDSSSDGTAIIAALERGLELGAQVAASRLGASATPQLVTTVAPSSPAGAVPDSYTFAAATTYDIAPTEYNGSPGENGIGVYGRSGCGRCAAYAAAHPDVAMIDIGNEQYRKTMWDTLKGRFKFTGTNVNLPVVITADGFTQAAK